MGHRYTGMRFPHWSSIDSLRCFPIPLNIIFPNFLVNSLVMSHQKTHLFTWLASNSRQQLEDKSWIHTVENNCSIFDDPELQLIVRVKAKMLCENLKTPIWHFDDSWRQDICSIMSSLVPPPVNRSGYWWVEMVCAGHHPLHSKHKAFQSLHTILAGYIAPLAGREKSCPLCFSQAYVGSYFNW